jgi:hypothetical protein
MDDKTQVLKEKLERLLREAAETAAELQTAEGGAGKPLHFSQIEAAAHQVGSRLSCRIQERTARELAADVPPEALCPACGTLHRLNIERRTVQSTDGPLDLWEPHAHCTRCRRDFFPSA